MSDELLIGMGTVLKAETARRVIEAGAQYVGSPCFDPETVRWCNQNNVVVCPGALTPTEILDAWHAGADLVKIFPCGFSGPDYVRALQEPLTQIPMIASGRVDARTAADFIKAGAIALCVGSALVDAESVARKDWARITRQARTLVAEVARARQEMKG
jgi:2-dehydro-3-deoxyphosphogluconate aldolase/(4S)-4-hydroxy-2-oxoglutarate aldolase